jgi:hypothetical protein
MLLAPLPCFAWGPEGHRIVGVDAVAMLDDTARAEVAGILGDISPDTVGTACFWPDTVRKTPAWEWSAPLHYVNIPRSALHYDPERDCPDGQCVTEAIVRYANWLTLPESDPEERYRNFAWLCHLVGDLHQPLHAGYRDDLGGNTVEVEYRGEIGNLHQFWDRVVIRDRLREGDAWQRPYSGPPWNHALEEWNPRSVRQWTDESHALVARAAYPDSFVISKAFADGTWLIIRQQWQKASSRLAGVLNATLGEGEVQIMRDPQVVP